MREVMIVLLTLIMVNVLKVMAWFAKGIGAILLLVISFVTLVITMLRWSM